MLECTRLGTRYGGWDIPLELLSENSICYCAGCGEDISFDISLIMQVGCHVFAFDPTPASINYVQKETRLVEKYHFVPVGLWCEDTKETFYSARRHKGVSRSIICPEEPAFAFSALCRRLATLMQDLGHNRIDLLKMDIEGAEYEVLDDMLRSGIQPQILCIEFHRVCGDSSEDTLSALEDNGYYQVHQRKSDWTLVHRKTGAQQE